VSDLRRVGLGTQWIATGAGRHLEHCANATGAVERPDMSSTDQHWDAAQDGAELVSEGEYARAIELLTQLIAEHPDNEYGYYYLGCAHYELEQFDRALVCYVRALELVPTYLGAMLHTGHTLRMLGRYNEAIRMGHQVLTRAPGDPDALYLIGACSFARGDNAQAQDYLERFLHTNPELEVATEAEGMLQILRNKLIEN
jgi:tetratricopeptide (TPR) repeat protein